MKTPDVARGAREAAAAVSDECVASHIADGGYSWTDTAPAPRFHLFARLEALRRNASGRRSRIRQMLCLLECSIVCGS
jgi:hypothetical protein